MECCYTQTRLPTTIYQSFSLTYLNHSLELLQWRRVEDSFSFASELSKMHNANYFIASFDITSLHINISTKETINLIMNIIFLNDDNFYNNFFRNSRILSSKQCIYFQRTIVHTKRWDDVHPHTLADIFLCHHEKIWLNNCPPQFKPFYCSRCVDNTFLLFRSQSHIPLFLKYLNSQHFLKSSFAKQNDNSVSSLDICILKH